MEMEEEPRRPWRWQTEFWEEDRRIGGAIVTCEAIFFRFLLVN